MAKLSLGSLSFSGGDSRSGRSKSLGKNHLVSKDKDSRKLFSSEDPKPIQANSPQQTKNQLSSDATPLPSTSLLKQQTTSLLGIQSKKVCPLCGGKTYIRTKDGFVACQCKQQKRMESIIRDSSIPILFQEASAQSIETSNPTNLKFIQLLQKDSYFNIFIQSSSFTRCQLAAIAVKRLVYVNQYSNIDWVCLDDLVQASFSDPQTFFKLRDVDVLTLDIDVDQINAAHRSVFSSILSRRFSMKKSTIIISTSKFSSIKSKYSGKISQLIEAIYTKFEVE